MAVQPIPDGYHSITPFLAVRGAGALVRFLEQAFGATTLGSMNDERGAVCHAELRIGDSRVMIGELPPERPPFTAMLYHYVADVDAAFARATAAGGTVVQPPTTQFYGDRSGAVADPAGNQWWLASRVEEVALDEMERRMKSRKK